MAAICVDSIFVIFYKFDFPGSRNLFLKLLPRIQSLGCPWTTSTTLTSTRNGPFNCENTRSHFYLRQNVLKPGASTNVQKRAVLRCLLVQKWRRDIDFDVFQVKSRPKVKFMWISWKFPWTKRPIIIILRECHNIWLVNSKSEIKINTQNQPGVKSTDHKHQSHILITSLTMKSFFTNQNLDYASNGILCLHILTYFHGHVKGQLSPTDINVPSWSGSLARYNSAWLQTWGSRW